MSLRKVITSPVWRKCGRHAYESRKQLIRGMMSYAVIWPAGSIVQQKIEGREHLDLLRVARFCVWGALFVAPTLTIWMTIARAFWPQSTLRAALTKALVEQVSYTPFAMTSFYFGMTLLEMKGIEAAKKEVTDKVLPTYKTEIPNWNTIFAVNRAPNLEVMLGMCMAAVPSNTSFIRILAQVLEPVLVGVLIWPILQTINYTTIPEKNRIVFVSFCSFVWTTFLAYMKQTDLEDSVLYKIKNEPASTPKK